MARGLKVVAIRHPMPYGDLVKQKVQRFATVADLKKHECTIEEMEEYEPHVVRGNVIYAGVDYEAILREAEKEADVILWDGGNNDFPFYVPDLMITVADPLRAGNELTYYPGEASLRMADVIVINKIDSASPEQVQTVRESIQKVNPDALVIDAASPITVDKPELIKGKRCLCVEDGPTLTHGKMKIGAGVVAARKFGAKELVDPRPYVVGKLKTTFQIYPEIGTPPARHGLRRGAGQGPREDHREDGLRHRRHRHAHRPLPHREDHEAHGEGRLRPAGDRVAQPHPGPRRVLQETQAREEIRERAYPFRHHGDAADARVPMTSWCGSFVIHDVAGCATAHPALFLAPSVAPAMIGAEAERPQARRQELLRTIFL